MDQGAMLEAVQVGLEQKPIPTHRRMFCINGHWFDTHGPLYRISKEELEECNKVLRTLLFLEDTNTDAVKSER